MLMGAVLLAWTALRLRRMLRGTDQSAPDSGPSPRQIQLFRLPRHCARVRYTLILRDREFLLQKFHSRNQGR